MSERTWTEDQINEWVWNSGDMVGISSYFAGKEAAPEPVVRCFETKYSRNGSTALHYCAIVKFVDDLTVAAYSCDGSAIEGAQFVRDICERSHDMWREFPASEWDVKVAAAKWRAKTSWPVLVPWNAETFPKDRPVWVRESHWSASAAMLIVTYGGDGVSMRYNEPRGDGDSYTGRDRRLLPSWGDLMRHYVQHDGMPCGTVTK